MAQKYNTPFPEWCCCGGGGGGGSASFFFLSETPDGITVGQGSSHSANTVLIQAQESIEMNAPSILIDGPFYIHDVNGETPDVTPLLENRGGVLFWNDSPLDTYGGVYQAGNGLALNEHDLQFYVNNGDYISFDRNGRLTVTVDSDEGVVSYSNFNGAVGAFEREINTLTRDKQNKLLYYTEVEGSKETKATFTLSTGTSEFDDSTIEVHDNHGNRELILRNQNGVVLETQSLFINGPMFFSDGGGTRGQNGPLLYNTSQQRLTFGNNVLAYKGDITNLQFITEETSPNKLLIGNGEGNLKVVVQDGFYFTSTVEGPLAYKSDSLYFGNVNLLHQEGEGIKIEAKESGKDEIRIKPCNISKLKEIEGTMGYLYDITYDSYSYDDARDINMAYTSGGACSTFRRGNYVARNFDWYFDNGVEFVVRSHNPGCREVIGVAANVGIKKQDLEQIYYDDLNKSNNFRTLPFMLVDGINDAGLVVSEHVVPHNASIYGENAEVVGSDPQSGNEFRIKALHLPRYILDHCANVAGVKEYLSTKTIVQPNELITAGYDLHYLVNDADGNHAIIEFVDNQIKFIDSTLGTTKNCLANFHVWSTEKTGPITLSSGRVLTPADGGGATTANHIEALGQGLERYNFMIDWMADSTKEDLYVGSNNELEVMKVMSGIWYSGVYTGVDSPFNTEYIGGGLTVDSPAINFELVKMTGKSIWDARTRQDTHTSQTPWQTTHCVVYNIPSRTLLIKVQEGARVDESAQSEEDGNMKLASFRSLNSIQEGYVIAGFHDDKKEGGNLSLSNGAIYRLATMDAASSSESTRDLSSITVGGLTTAEIHFKVGTGTGDGTINTITFPSTWRWINETDETVDNTRFTTGNTYAVVVRNNGVDTIANVAYEYTTTVPGPIEA